MEAVQSTETDKDLEDNVSVISKVVSDISLSSSEQQPAPTTPKTPRPIPAFAPVTLDPHLLLTTGQSAAVKRRLLNSPSKPSMDRSPRKKL